MPPSSSTAPQVNPHIHQWKQIGARLLPTVQYRVECTVTGCHAKTWLDNPPQVKS